VTTTTIDIEPRTVVCSEHALTNPLLAPTQLM
jgi:hypothetical protein